MGYSVMVEFSDEAIRARMLSFLERHLTPISTMLGDEHAYVRGPVADPSYGKDDATDRLIGFDFTTSFPVESRVAYLLCYWMARRVPGSTIWYDGHERREIPADCDEHGFEPLEWMEKRSLEIHMRRDQTSPDYVAYLNAEMEQISAYNAVVRGELERLTTLFAARG